MSVFGEKACTIADFVTFVPIARSLVSVLIAALATTALCLPICAALGLCFAINR